MQLILSNLPEITTADYIKGCTPADEKLLTDLLGKYNAATIIPDDVRFSSNSYYGPGGDYGLTIHEESYPETYSTYLFNCIVKDNDKINMYLRWHDKETPVILLIWEGEPFQGLREQLELFISQSTLQTYTPTLADLHVIEGDMELLR